MTGDDYRDSHRDSSKPAAYDPKFFDPKMTLGLMWQIERKIIGEIVAEMAPAPKRALDFACGTGRILSRVEELVPECVGVDISAPMLEVARQRCPGATLVEADLSADPASVTETFDLITSFRFLLNAQAELRAAALGALRARIDDGGLFITNFHRNPISATGVYLRAMARLRGREQAKMIGLAEASQLLRANGFEPVVVRGYGYLLQRTERLTLAPIVGAVEKRLAAWNPVPSLALNFIVAARPIPVASEPGE
jgi:ubiquinone/menaquinone biosynthesis C-methylase UbiE